MHKPFSSSGNLERGNVLFLILIAVALFAALSYVVTSSSRSGGSNISEKDRMEAARILGFQAQIKATLDRMLIKSGADITQIRFNNDVYLRADGSVINAMGSPTNVKNYVFHPQGGGAIPMTFEDIARPCPLCTTNTKPGHISISWGNNFPGMGTDGTGGGDLGLGISGIAQNICMAVNESQGIPKIPTNTTITNLSTPAFTGQVAPSFAGVVMAGTDAPLLQYKTAYCLYDSGTDRYNFYALLKAY